jgi:hypothetical protein
MNSPTNGVKMKTKTVKLYRSRSYFNANDGLTLEEYTEFLNDVGLKLVSLGEADEWGDQVAVVDGTLDQFVEYQVQQGGPSVNVEEVLDGLGLLGDLEVEAN